jgi:hypothetical protein
LNAANPAAQQKSGFMVQRDTARQHFCTKDEDAGLIPRFKDAHFVRDLNAMTLSSSAIYVP